eukprot:TRINITY_DN2240_c0_g1_i4.p1 TRINITY_DN2240_c0_g1~~TRINITY_DN2240_c0_g1_i4.p1  ORF type:complete len:1048 (+),score=283.70 TRINITY_DN2240_c0_g1_i4:105-3146(+)
MLVDIDPFDTVINLLGWLATPAGGSVLLDVRLPPTVVFRNGVARECVQWQPERGLTKEADLSPAAVQRALLGTSGVVDPQCAQQLAAFAVSRRDDSLLGDRRPFLTVDYYTHDRLRYVLGAPPLKRDGFKPLRTAEEANLVWTGLLQQFVPPLDDCNSMIEVLWSPDSVKMEARRNVHPVAAANVFPFQRGATFEGPLHLSEPDENIPNKHVSRIKEVCRHIAGHLRLLTLRSVDRMLLYFKLDKEGEAWLLWCRQLRLHGDAADGPPRFRIPSQYRPRSNVKPRPTSPCILEEDLIEEPTLPPAGDMFYLPISGAAPRRGKLLEERHCLGAGGWAQLLRRRQQGAAAREADSSSAVSTVTAETHVGILELLRYGSQPSPTRPAPTPADVIGSTSRRPLADLYDGALVMIKGRPLPRREEDRRALWEDPPGSALSSPRSPRSPKSRSAATSPRGSARPPPAPAPAQQTPAPAQQTPAPARRTGSRIHQLTRSAVTRRMAVLRKRRQRVLKECCRPQQTAGVPRMQRRIEGWLRSCPSSPPELAPIPVVQQRKPEPVEIEPVAAPPAPLSPAHIADTQSIGQRVTSEVDEQSTQCGSEVFKIHGSPVHVAYIPSPPSSPGSPFNVVSKASFRPATSETSRALRAKSGRMRATSAGPLHRAPSVTATACVSEEIARRPSYLLGVGGTPRGEEIQLGGRKGSAVGLIISPEQTQRKKVDTGGAEEEEQFFTPGVWGADVELCRTGEQSPDDADDAFNRTKPQSEAGRQRALSTRTRSRTLSTKPVRMAAPGTRGRRRSSVVTESTLTSADAAPLRGKDELPGWVALALADFDSEFAKGSKSFQFSQARALLLFRRDPPQTILSDTAALGVFRELARTCELCVEFLDGLVYHVTSRGRGKDRLVFSVSPRLGPVLCDALCRFFATQKKHLRRVAPAEAVRDGLLKSSAVPAQIAFDELYSAHVSESEHEASLAQQALWEVTPGANSQQLAWAASDWVQTPLRGHFLFRKHEISKSTE